MLLIKVLRRGRSLEPAAGAVNPDGDGEFPPLFMTVCDILMKRPKTDRTVCKRSNIPPTSRYFPLPQ